MIHSHNFQKNKLFFIYFLLRQTIIGTFSQNFESIRRKLKKIEHCEAAPVRPAIPLTLCHIDCVISIQFLQPNSLVQFIMDHCKVSRNARETTSTRKDRTKKRKQGFNPKTTETTETSSYSTSAKKLNILKIVCQETILWSIKLQIL